MFRRAAVLLLLLGPACSGFCYEQDEVAILLDPAHPQLLISVSANAQDIVSLSYAADNVVDELDWEVDAPCRVAIYNYGSGEVDEPWPMPGDPPSPGVQIDRDFVLTGSEDRTIRLSEWFVREVPGPVTGTIVLTSCGTATVRGELKITGQCKDIYEHDAGPIELEIVTRQSPDDEG